VRRSGRAGSLRGAGSRLGSAIQLVLADHQRPAGAALGRTSGRPGSLHDPPGLRRPRNGAGYARSPQGDRGGSGLRVRSRRGIGSGPDRVERVVQVHPHRNPGQILEGHRPALAPRGEPRLPLRRHPLCSAGNPRLPRTPADPARALGPHRDRHRGELRGRALLGGRSALLPVRSVRLHRHGGRELHGHVLPGRERRPELAGLDHDPGRRPARVLHRRHGFRSGVSAEPGSGLQSPALETPRRPGTDRARHHVRAGLSPG